MKEFLEKNYCSKNCDELTQKECHEGIRTRCLAFEEREELLKDFTEPKLVNGYTYEQLLETIENAKKTVTKEITNLQQENNRLAQHIVELQKDKGQLIDELTKKADTNHSLVEQMAGQNEQLEQAKEIIKELLIIRISPNADLVNNQTIYKAEQFLKE